MYNSIKYFEEECINKFEKLEDDFMKEPQKLAEYVLELTEELHNLGLRMIYEEFVVFYEYYVYNSVILNKFHGKTSESW